jgi:hypothetical protein
MLASLVLRLSQSCSARASVPAASAKIGMDTVTAPAKLCAHHPGGRNVPTPEEAVLSNFMRDGRIVTMPAKRSRRLVLLDYVAQNFEIGVRYAESEVNRTLRDLHEDYAALRRYLIDEGFMTREHGVYWRTGGSVSDTP